MKFMIMGLTLLMSSMVWSKEPYRMLIVADDESVQAAEEFKQHIITQPPFNRIKPDDLEIRITKVPKSTLKCQDDLPSSEAARKEVKGILLTCDTNKVAKMQADTGSHMAMIFTSQAKGGSGVSGGISIASSQTTGHLPNTTVSPSTVMTHEMLHHYGCADEYEYGQEALDVHCKSPGAQSSPNLAIFRDLPPYKSDGNARSMHAKDVPWMRDIRSFVPIVNQGELGTKKGKDIKVGSQSLGLYRGGSCDKVTPTWRPYEKSIMRGHTDTTIYPLYQELIIKNIESKIFRKLELEEDCPPPGNVKPNVKMIDDLMRALRK